MEQQTKRDVVLSPARMALAEHWRQDWCVNAELGTTLEDIQDNGYFSHMAQQLKPYDHIEVRIEDGSWIANLIVINAERNWARVKLLNCFDLTDEAATSTASKKNSVEWKGPQHKWCVIRTSDGDKIKTGCLDRAEADLWLREYEKVAA